MYIRLILMKLNLGNFTFTYTIINVITIHYFYRCKDDDLALCINMCLIEKLPYFTMLHFSSS